MANRTSSFRIDAMNTNKLRTGLFVLCAALYAQPTLGNGNRLFLECPCRIVFDGEMLTVTAGVQNFRQTHSEELRIIVSVHPDSESEHETLATLPLLVTVAADQRLSAREWSTAINTSTLTGESTLSLRLDERQGESYVHQDEVRMKFPVNLERAFAVGDLDYLKDTDGDGIGDVNEQLMSTDPADAESAPGSSTIDVLALYTQGFADLYEGDAVSRISHLYAGANAMLRDSALPIRFRVVGAKLVVVENEDEWFARVDQDVLLEEGDRHGADRTSLFTIQPPNVPAGYACAFGSRSRGFWAIERAKTCYINVKGRANAFILMHETGHDMGLAHSVSQGEYGTWRWSRGHDVPDDFTTIMSYGRGGIRLNVFSSADGTCRGALGRDKPCGVPRDRDDGADAVTSLDAIRFQVARTRPALEDADDDGFVDSVDAFPNDPTDWWDADDDSLGDNADPDDDNDGVADGDDAFPLDGGETADSDEDGLGDNADAFPLDPEETADADGDGVGDNTDLFPDDPQEWVDTDGDGVGDNADLWPEDPAESADTDGDGIGDNADPDADNDGVADVVDLFPLDGERSSIGSYLFVGERAGDRIGDVLSAAGIEDGQSMLIVGAPQHDADGAENVGAAYLISAAEIAGMDAADGVADRIVGLGHVTSGAGSWKLVGEAGNDRAGSSVASTGDMDGDGIFDVIVGAPNHHGANSRWYAGAAYFVSGADFEAADAADGVVDRTILVRHVAAQAHSWKFVGETICDSAGSSVAATADRDDDGRPELIMGSATYCPVGDMLEPGAAYLVASGDFAAVDAADGDTDGVVDLGNVASQAASYKFIGEASGDRAGASVATAGDIDGDGTVDLLIGAPGHKVNEQDGVGAAYAVSGNQLAALDAVDSEADGVIDLGRVAMGTGSWKLQGARARERAGRDVSPAGDADGDGLADLLLNGSWVTYLVSSAALTSADAADGETDGLVSLGEVAAQANSWKFQGLDKSTVAGDVDGDGSADLLGAFPWHRGEAHVFSPKAPAGADAAKGMGIVDGVVDRRTLREGEGSWTITGARVTEFLGSSVSAAGDVDRDGLADLLLGASGIPGSDTPGSVYLVLAADLAALDGTDGSRDRTMHFGNFAGDTNADGVANLFDRDDDGDGVPDHSDAFQLDSTEWADSDGDGVGDNADAFPQDNLEQIDTDGDGLGDRYADDDDDGDGVVDNEDPYPLDTDNDGTENRDDPDDDGDGVADAEDAFPVDPAESSDTDGDGLGNSADTDDDGDGVPDDEDTFPLDPGESVDADGDGVGDNGDAFPFDPNETHDYDGDGVGDNADDDDDNDGVVDDEDRFPHDAGTSRDTDDDGVPDARDAFPSDPDESVDTDGDGDGDNADTDDDGDGVNDNDDLFPLDKSRSTLTSYKFVPESAGDRVGASLASAGDLDGDGRPELLIAAPKHEQWGAVYAISPADLVGADEADGTPNGEVKLGRIAAQPRSWKLIGEAGREAGTALAPIGDLDGNGSLEFAVGSDGFQLGAVDIVSGADLVASDAMDGVADGIVALDSVSAAPGSWRLVAENRTQFGTSVSAAQRVDTGSVLVAQPGWGGGAWQGSAHRVNGAGLLELDTIDGRVDGQIALGSAGGQHYFLGEQSRDAAGYSLAAWDFDGDGEADAIVGAPRHDAGRIDVGAVYLIGSSVTTGGRNDLGTIASRSHSWKFAGTSFSEMGTSVSLGDFDGDGQPDLVLGSRTEVIVVSGTSAHFERIDRDDGILDGVVDLDLLGAHRGSRRMKASARIAAPVVGDFDGDGMSDLLIGVNNQGSTLAYLVPASSFFDGETVSLDTLSSRPGVYNLRVSDRSAADVSVGAAGDVDGDGLDDFLLALVPQLGRVYEPAAAYLVTAADLPLLDLGGVIYLSKIVSSRP